MRNNPIQMNQSILRQSSWLIQYIETSSFGLQGLQFENNLRFYIIKRNQVYLWDHLGVFLHKQPTLINDNDAKISWQLQSTWIEIKLLYLKDDNCNKDDFKLDNFMMALTLGLLQRVLGMQRGVREKLKVDKLSKFSSWSSSMIIEF